MPADSPHFSIDALLEAFSLQKLAYLALLLPFQESIPIEVWLRMGTQLFGDPPENEPFSLDHAFDLLGEASKMGLVAFDATGHPSPRAEGIQHFVETIRETFHIPKETLQEAFVIEMGRLGNQLSHGAESHLSSIQIEEKNLLNALQMARASSDGYTIFYIAPALKALWLNTGRRQDWLELAEHLAPDFTDSKTGAPVPGREDHWSQVMELRVALARHARRWDDALRLQKARVEWDRKRANKVCQLPSESLSTPQQNLILCLAISLSDLAESLMQSEEESCLPLFLEAKDLYNSMEYSSQAAVCSFNVGLAHLTVPSLRDLDHAERWFKESLQQSNDIGKGKALGELGYVALARMREKRAAKAPGEELLEQLNISVGFYKASLEYFPQDAYSAIATSNHQLGNLYGEVQYVDEAAQHYASAVQHFEHAGDVLRASEARASLATLLGNAERWQESLCFAQEALAGFESCGQSADEHREATRQLIEQIQQAAK